MTFECNDYDDCWDEAKCSKTCPWRLKGQQYQKIRKQLFR